MKLKQQLNVLESEKSEFIYQKQKLTSGYEMRIAILESEKEYLQRNIDKYKRQVSNSMKDNSQEEQMLMDKVAKKNAKIQNLECSNLSLRKKLVEYEDEILSLKIHNSRAPVDLHESPFRRIADKDDLVESDPIHTRNTVITSPIVVEKETFFFCTT